MISQSAFEEGIERNVERITHYESGGDGSGGGCDCIGLDIGALRLMGGKWPWTHGTNYTVRNRMQGFRRVTNANELKKGELVFKARKPGESRYDLPAKYQTGGKEYNGDLNDYYHVGTVTNVNPLRITHCTSVEGGIQVDSTLGKWAYAGWLDQVKKDETHDEKGEQGTMKQYRVTGGKLKLRKGPSQNNAVIKMIPDGAIVSATDDEMDGWIRVEYEGTEGYCMFRYLEPAEEPALDDDSVAAAIEIAFANVYSALDELKMLITSVL